MGIPSREGGRGFLPWMCALLLRVEEWGVLSGSCSPVLRACVGGLACLSQEVVRVLRIALGAAVAP